MRMPKLLVGAIALAFLFSTSAFAQKGRSSSRPSGGSSRPSGWRLHVRWEQAEHAQQAAQFLHRWKEPYRCRWLDVRREQTLHLVEQGQQEP